MIPTRSGYVAHSRIARRGETQVMFLGGRLDHATRAVAASSVDPTRPAEDTHIPLGLMEAYDLRKCKSGPWVWWVYVLQGHDPTPMDLIDANPGPFYRQ